MHRDHGVFITALEGLTKVRLTFVSKEDGHALVRTCAPMDYGPSRRSRDKSDRYHLWDYDSDQAEHVLSLLAAQITAIQALDERFDPAEFITWSPGQWYHARDWGPYS